MKKVLTEVLRDINSARGIISITPNPNQFWKNDFPILALILSVEVNHDTRDCENLCHCRYQRCEP